jgi:hypothetical protein
LLDFGGSLVFPLNKYGRLIDQSDRNAVASRTTKYSIAPA